MLFKNFPTIVLLICLLQDIQALPVFQLNDQYGKTYRNSDFLGKPSLFLTCSAVDIEICRKVGRKIYWKLQNLLWKDSDKVVFQLVILVPEENVLIDKYIQESKGQGFERVLLDRKGVFSDHNKKGMAHLDINNKQGKSLHNFDYSSIDDDQIQEIFVLLKPLIQ